ncbi:hypothetical protein [Actinophytocola glycyrrhizae]|uniref:Uncharacterized protein n=1 Tax=Actinophytocola glycyrrhizae TaxID=2044873 RepID=A0ABV9S8Y6_9PSEU
MSDTVRLVYTEFDPGAAPFAWLRGRRLTTDVDRSEIYRIMAMISAAAKVVERPGARAMRYLDDGNTMLVELDLSEPDPGGAPTRLTVVLVVDDSTPRPLAGCAGLIVAELAGAGISAEEGRVRAALEWGWANSALQFPRLVAWYRRLMAKVRGGQGFHSVREGKAV